MVPERSDDLPVRRKVVAGLSGGVDSAVAALLALRSGYETVGVTLLTLGTRPEGARAVCQHLGIEHRGIDAVAQFEACVVRNFLDASVGGSTPNPCIECNPHVKFAVLGREAEALGGAAITTGHYARIRRHGDSWHLLRAVDRAKDQSYMLYRLDQEILARLLLPLGEYTKDQVREIAAEAGLPAASREESQDICFAPEGVEAFIAARRPEAALPGPILDLDGREVGRHRGLAFYTVGQRRGLGIGGPGGRWYVLRILPAHNALVVGTEADLRVGRCEVERVRLVGAPPGDRFAASVMTRYRGVETPAEVQLQGDRAIIRFRGLHPAAAPGQSAVFYGPDTDAERLIGGGIIVPPED